MSKVVGPALQIIGILTGDPILTVIGTTISYFQAKADQRKAARRAKDAYNAALEDRMQMVDLRADAPRTLVLGRVRAVEGIRRRWTSGTNSEKLTLIVSFAGHEIDAFEQFWFNDTPLTIDGSGYVQTAPYLKTDKRTDVVGTGTLNGSGSLAVTLSSTPIAGTLSAIWRTDPGLTGEQQGQLTITGSGVNYTLSGGPAGASVTYSWQTTIGTSMARIRTYLGTSAQNVGAALAAEYPGKVTATDRFAGIALAVVDLTYDPDVYPQGIPNITATMRGAKCLDPRSATTAWTDNPALHAYLYARLSNGWAVPSTEIRTQDIIDAANFCDTSTTFDLGGTPTVLPRYRSNIVVPSDADPRSAMEEILEAMAGRWGWAGGTLRFRAGRMATPVWAMDESWIAQRVGPDGMPEQSAVVRITNGVPRESKVNRVTGRCVDSAQRYQILPFPAVHDDVLIDDEGAEYSLEVEYQAVSDIAHAQHLAKIAIRQAQAALRMEATCNLSAYRVELFDVGTVTVARYGMSAKTFECIGWRWHPTEGVLLKLAEITDEIFSTAALTGRDPAPNSDLPSPWSVAAITGVVVTSGTALLTDGSVLTRTKVAWTSATSQAVLVGGQIEVQFSEVTQIPASGDWPSWMEQGSATSATIAGLITNHFYAFRVRAINSLGVRGPWSSQVWHKVAAPPASGATPLLRLKATSLVVSFDASGNASPASQTITLEAQLQNLSGTAVFDCQRYTAVGASLGAVTLGGSGNTRTLTETQFGAAAYATVSATLSGLTDGVTITRVQSGANGLTSALVALMQRTTVNSAPALPSATLTYTFATGALTGTLGAWSTTVPSSGGGYLWITQALASGTGTTDTIAPADWSAARLLATDGAPGTPGTNGTSAARAYALYTGNPVVTGTSVVTSGTSLPSSSSWSPASATAWSSNVQTPGTNQSLFQSDGLYNPATNQTTWGLPYLSNFKVGSLSAISADLGTITAGSISTSGFIRADGNTSLLLPDPLLGGSVTRTVALTGNFSGTSQVGTVGISGTASVGGVYGYNSNASGYGVIGYSNNVGVFGFGPAGVSGSTSSATGFGVIGTSANLAGSVGVQALALNAAAFALKVVGQSTVSGRITSTLSDGSAPIVLPRVATKPPAISGGVAIHNTYGLIVSDGVNWFAPSALQVVP